MIAAMDEAEVEQAEPIAGPSGLCGQQLSAAPSQDAMFIDAMEEVCTIQIIALIGRNLELEPGPFGIRLNVWPELVKMLQLFIFVIMMFN